MCPDLAFRVSDGRGGRHDLAADCAERARAEMRHRRDRMVAQNLISKPLEAS